MPGRSALVTGGAGFIGSHLVDKLLQLGYHVSILDNMSSGRAENIERHIGKKNFKLIRGPVTDRSDVRRSLRGVDVVFHHAALPSVMQSVSSPLVVDRVNSLGTLLLLDEARKADAKRFVFASSAAVYGSSGRPPLREDSILDPDSPYGASKIAGEAYCTAFFSSYGMETVVLRYFNVYGPRCGIGSRGGVMVRMAENVARGLPIEIFGDGRQTRDFVYVSDVVRANVIAAKSSAAPGETFNIGTGSATSINELAEILRNSALASRRVPIIHHKARPGEIVHSVASISKAREMMGFVPATDVSDGVRKFVTWYRDVRGAISR